MNRVHSLDIYSVALFNRRNSSRRCNVFVVPVHNSMQSVSVTRKIRRILCKKIYFLVRLGIKSMNEMGDEVLYPPPPSLFFRLWSSVNLIVHHLTLMRK